MNRPHWISTSTALPERDQLVIVWVGGDYEFAFYDPASAYNDRPWDVIGEGWRSSSEVTYWCPLPEEPNQ
jgi:hypothetical protein